ncbi:hypothetical protein Sjap_013720 [Stephania japonica]|uniref:Uncharacterized protein n=1 Tax=Stephania japonica TaxID=461633 RepID=A0AAP0NYW0_9MAGN
MVYKSYGSNHHNLDLGERERRSKVMESSHGAKTAKQRCSLSLASVVAGVMSLLAQSLTWRNRREKGQRHDTTLTTCPPFSYRDGAKSGATEIHTWHHNLKIYKFGNKILRSS